MEKKYLREDHVKGQRYLSFSDSRKEDIQKIEIHEQKCFAASPQLKWKTLSFN